MNGSLRNYYNEIVAIDEKLREAKGKNVVIELPEPVDGFLEFVAEEDPDHWVNKEISGYYGNTSVRKIIKY